LRIFLNYRREDTRGDAGRLYDDLAERFGAQHVFRDIDTLEPGSDFDVAIEQAVKACDVLIALVGSRWSSVKDASGRRRIENPDDFVRLELQAALAGSVRIIPVRVEGAEMPSSDELPEALRRFAKKHALELSDSRWRHDRDRLVRTLERIAESKADAEREAERETAERERAERETAERAERERAEHEAAERAERERAGREAAERAAAAREAVVPQGEGTYTRKEAEPPAAGGALTREATTPTETRRRGRTQRPRTTTSAPARARTRVRHRLIAFLLVLGITAALLTFVLSGGSNGPNPAGHAVGRPIRILNVPDDIAVGGHKVWVRHLSADSFNVGLTSIDPDTGSQVGSPITLQTRGSEHGAIAVADGLVWVANEAGAVTRIDAATGKVIGHPTRVGKVPEGIAVGQGRVWVTNSQSSSVSRIDAASGGAIGPPTPVSRLPRDIAVGEGSVWVTHAGNNNTVTRLDADTGKVVGPPIAVGASPVGIEVAGGSVWVANSLGNTVTRIDAKTGSVIGEPIRVGKMPKSVAAGVGAIWVANAGERTVTRLDPSTGKVVGRPISISKHPEAIAAGQGGVWVTEPYAFTVQRIDPHPG
jgi:DNA-binding beta-propeller fold protein YncE